MPRIREIRPRHERLRVLLQGTAAALDKSAEEVARIWGCSLPTAYKRMRDPGCITVDQLLTIGRGLGIPLDEIRNAISEK